MKNQFLKILAIGFFSKTTFGMEISRTSVEISPISKTKEIGSGLNLIFQQPPLHQDCLTVAIGLKKFNDQQTGQIFQREIKLSFNKTPEIIIGEFYQYALYLHSTPLEDILANHGANIIDDILTLMEDKGHQIGARQLFTECTEGSDLTALFEAHGYHSSPGTPNFQKNALRNHFYKDINLKRAALDLSSDIEITIQNPPEQGTKTNFLFDLCSEILQGKKPFGIFIRDTKTKTIKGGVFGSFISRGTPHCYINILWVDNESLGRRGLGSRLMKKAETYAKKQGVSHVLLDTNGFQASTFYSKIGYTILKAFPNNLVLLNGTLSSFYVCMKSLFPNINRDMVLKPYQNTYFGERLFLRPLFPEDYTSLIPIYTNPQAMKYLGFGKILSIKEIKNMTQKSAHSQNEMNPEYLIWAIISHQGIAGRVHFKMPCDEMPFERELAYHINPAFSGKGIATQASQLVLNSTEGPFLATVHPHNIASREVLKKLGFRSDPTRGNIPKYGSVRDYYLLKKNKKNIENEPLSLGKLLNKFVAYFDEHC